MKFSKRLSTVTLSALMLMSAFSMSALAVDTTASTQDVVTSSVNEYDVYMNLNKASDKELRVEGFSTSEIESIRNDNVEQELYTRAQMSDDELQSYGYTSEQIEILREYDGSPLEFNPQMRAVGATFNGSIRKDSSTSSSATVIFNWSWSSAPIVCLPGLNDYAVCAWQGTNRSNQQSTMRVESAYCSLTYADGAVKSTSVSIQDRYKWVKANVEQQNGRSWVKSGALIVQARQEYTTNDLYSTTFAFGFGHAVLAINGGVSIDASGPSLGFTFGTKVDDVFNRDLTIRH